MQFGGKRIKKRIFVGATALLTTVGVVAGVLFSDVDKVYAKVTLRGIENIAQIHSTVDEDGKPDPFVILEVVPNYSDASIGYLISEEEPLYEGRSIKGMPSKEERNVWINSFKSKIELMNSAGDPSLYTEDRLYQLYKNGAFSYSDYTEYGKDVNLLPEESRKAQVRGVFKSAIESKDNQGIIQKGWYNQNDYSNAYRLFGTQPGENDISDIYDDKNVNKLVVYRKTDAYRTKDEFYKGGYTLSLAKIKNAMEMPVKTLNDDAGNSIYNWQYFSVSRVTDTSKLFAGDYIYCSDRDASGQYVSYFGQIRRDSDGKLKLFVCDNSNERVLNSVAGDNDIDADRVVKSVEVTEEENVSAKVTESATPTSLVSPTATESVTPTSSVSPTASETASVSTSPSAIETASVSPTEGSPSPLATPTATPSATNEESTTPTSTPESTKSATASPTNTESASTSSVSPSASVQDVTPTKEVTPENTDNSGTSPSATGSASILDNNGEGTENAAGTVTPSASPSEMVGSTASASPAMGEGNMESQPSASASQAPSEEHISVGSENIAGNQAAVSGTQTIGLSSNLKLSYKVGNVLEELALTNRAGYAFAPDNINVELIEDSTEENNESEEALETIDGEVENVASEIEASKERAASDELLGAPSQGFSSVISLEDMVSDARVRDYYVVTETNSAEVGSYRISEIRENQYGPYGRKQGYSQVLGKTYNSTNAGSDKAPYYVKLTDQDEYIYAENRNGDFDFVEDYSKDLYQTFNYSGGIKNNEWFKQFVFDRTYTADNTKECDDLSIEVITVTLKDIGDFVDKADLVYFTGGRYSADEDISQNNARKLLNRVAEESLPVIIERSTLMANIYISESEPEVVNLTLLMLELMQDEVKSLSEEEWRTIAGDFASKHIFDVIVNREDPATGQVAAFAAISGNRVVETPSSYVDIDTGSEVYTLNFGEVYRGDISSYREELIKGLIYPYDSTADVSCVHKTIFVNDDWNDEWQNENGFKGRVINTAKVVWSDFNTSYSEAKISGINGFQEMIDEYANERPIIENYGKWDEFNSEISKATCIRYIINANQGRYKVKNELRILDLEPFESDQYTEEVLSKDIYYDGELLSENSYKLTRDNIDADWVKENLDIDFDEKKHKITVKQMGTKEFIGKNEDLNATYDMIYIGMDTALMNTKIDKEERVKTKDSVYNDSNMNGLIYSHLGDLFRYTFWSDWGHYRLAGNDITTDKLRELTDYVKAGYALLLSDDFFNYDDNNIVTGINTKKLDKSSNLYKLINNVVMAKKSNGDYLYWGKNVYRKGALENTFSGYASARKNFAPYVNVSKLSIKAIELPIAYNDIEKGTEGNYLELNSNGVYSLDYTIELKNDAALDSSDTTYDCKLYLDMDADGKFEDIEEQGGLQINNGSEIMEDGKYHLKAGNTYVISREVPEEYIGFLSWKLAFVENSKQTEGSNIGPSEGDERSEEAIRNATSVRTAITGYSAVPAPIDNRPSIDVLQITPNDKNGNNNNNLNLASADMQTLYDEVKDFGVNVYTIKVEDFLLKKDDTYRASSMSYYDYLCQFDMVVLGFTDMFDFNITTDTAEVENYRLETEDKKVTRTKKEIAHEATLALREYALSGRSILFTHDLTSSFTTVDYQQGYQANNYLRDLMGMDRFGKLNLSTLTYEYDRDATIKEYKSVYDNTGLMDSITNENSGLNDTHVLRWRSTNPDNGGVAVLKYGLTTRKASSFYNVSDELVPKNGDITETVSAVNEGQITQYPFLITSGTSGEGDNSSFEVSMTHTQYFQLNLDTDSTDENYNDDIVVWYTISNKNNSNEYLHPYYRAVYNDVRNNYYIYSKGNVMYTGSGHSNVTSQQEKKLFVNTLVASYNSGLHAPKIHYKENPWDVSADIASMYLPYDVSLIKPEQAAADSSVVAMDNTGGFSAERIKVNIKTINNNFRESKELLNVKYYVKDETGTSLIVGEENYKEIVPVSCKLVTEGNIKEAETIDNPYELKNYSVYQLEFNVDDLNLGGGSGVLPEDKTELYIQIGSEELSTGSVSALTATESLNGLEIFTARLFDLE